MDIGAMNYTLRFAIDREFRESRPWMKWVGENLAFIPANVWTSSRFLAVVIPFLQLNPYLELAIYVLLLSTDLIDGLVARSKNKKGTILGAILDAAADQTLMATAFVSIVSRLTDGRLIIALIAMEVLVYFTFLIVKFREVSQRGEKFLSIFNGKNGKELSKHTGIRKFKFVVQAILLVFSEIGIILKAESGWWTATVTASMFFIIALSAWSAIRRIREPKP